MGVPFAALVLVAAAAFALGPLLLQGGTATPSASSESTKTPAQTDTPSNTSVPQVDVPTGPPAPPTPLPPSRLTGYVWPLTSAQKPLQITLPFGPSKWGDFIVGGQLFHDGVDMATACGDKVLAAHDGLVLAAGVHYDDYMGWNGDLSRYYAYITAHNWWKSSVVPIVIVIDDGDGYRSIYAHESKATVKPGDRVKAGQTIGYEGASGNATGCHLHFGLFSPAEMATFANTPRAMAAPDHLPASVTARIDPLLVLPYDNDFVEMRTLRPSDAAAWSSAHPTK